MAAARALQLDFIPVAEERYDILIPREYLDNSPSIQQLLNCVHSGTFKEAVEQMGGYSTRATGNQVM